MSSACRICIIGLGNPGPRYRGTRHNIGFDWVDRVNSSSLFDDPQVDFKEKFEALWVQRKWKRREVHLLKPQTFMNLSGKSLRKWKEKFQGDYELLVAYDELDFEVGIGKLRLQGSDGGHRGMKSIIEVFGSRDVPRLRIGIGRPAVKEDVSDYVLTKFKPDEKATIEKLLEDAPRHLEVILEKGFEVAMNEINSKDYR